MHGLLLVTYEQEIQKNLQKEIHIFMKEIKLKDIINLRPFTRILINGSVETDDAGCYLINVGYIRVSTDKQAEEGFGLDAQQHEIEKYCKNNDLTNLLLFVDDGYTGTVMDRPALNEIIEMINAYNDGVSNVRIETLIVPRIDRLGRTTLGTLQFIQDYIVAARDSKNSTVNRNKDDINFISVAENYCRIERSNPQGKFLLMLFASLAEFDRDQIVQKLKRGMIERVSKGYWPGGGGVPYGYSYDKNTGILQIIPEEADKIREVFRLYIDERMAPQRIADRLGFKGDRIVTQILQRKSLTGCLTYLDKEYPGLHEPIISLDRWNEAQEVMASRSANRVETNYLLSGLVYCGECGAKMRYQKWGKAGAKLICYSQQASTKPNLVHDENCENEKYWASDVEDAVVAELFRMSFLCNPENQKAMPTIDLTATLEQELASLEKQLRKLYTQFSTSDGEDSVLLDCIAGIKAKIQKTKDQINDQEKLSKLEERVDHAQKMLRTLKSTWPHMTPKEQQTVCRELIDRVVISKDYKIDVHLKMQNFLMKDDGSIPNSV